VADTCKSLADTIDALQSLNPCGGDLLEVHNNYAYLLHLQGNSEAAIQAYKDTLKLDLTNKNSFTLDLNADKKLYKKCISEIHENLGWVLVMLGRKDEALVNLKSCTSFKHSESILAQKVKVLVDYYQKSERSYLHSSR
jgi:tetratricopeptide (TPR) repeat protein